MSESSPARVFLSHTAELREYPLDRSFVEAAEAAVTRAGGAVTEMAYFAAADAKPSDYCQRLVRSCDVYVGLIGLRYGSRRARPVKYPATWHHGYMSESHDEERAEELTVHEPHGSGFFHVSFSGPVLTVGCSTQASASGCFDALFGASRQNASLRSMIGSPARWTAQEMDETGQIQIVTQAIAFRGNTEGFLADLAPEAVAVRLDVGDWAWQWDDLEPGRPSARRSFGGLTGWSNFSELLYSVIPLVGDDWVQSEFNSLEERATRFLEQRAPGFFEQRAPGSPTE